MKRVLLSMVVVVVALGIVGYVAWERAAPIVRPNLQQPLLFPHSVHVQLVKLDCRFCHRTTTQVSPNTAGYPALQQCMFCHKVVDTDQPAIQKLRAAYESNQPINWVRVYLLPDHVHFVHEPHIRAGFDCSRCHGDVANMQQVTQATVFRMGVCVDCHRANNAPTDCSICHN